MANLAQFSIYLPFISIIYAEIKASQKLLLVIHYLKLAHFLLTLVGTVVAFRANERLFHIDYLFKYIDPQILVNSRNLSETKENNKFKFFQSLVLKDIDTKNCN